MKTPGVKPWTVRPWIVIIGIIGLYTSYSIILKSIGLSSQADKSLRPHIHFMSNLSSSESPRQMVMTAFSNTHTTTDKYNLNYPMKDQLCYPTTNYHFIKQVDQDSQAILLQSYYGSTVKTMGGDEFYPTITLNNPVSGKEEVMAVGRVSELSEGRYALYFKSLNENVLYNISDQQIKSIKRGTGYFLNIMLQYSCSEGMLPPPAKYHRSDGGAINKLVPVWFPSSLQQQPLIVRTEERPSHRMQINLKKFKLVLALGDSLMEQMVQGGKLSSKTVVPPWIYKKIQAPLASDKMETHFMKAVQKACKTPQGGMFLGIDKNHVALPKRDACSTNSTLLILNSGIWDLLEDGNFSKSKTCCNYDLNFEDHLGSLRALLLRIRDEFPYVTIGWKSVTAAHVHRTACGSEAACNLRIKYMSNSRATIIYQMQMELLQREFPDVLIVDLYEFTYYRAHLSRPGDGRHYRCDRKSVGMCQEMWNRAFGDSGWGSTPQAMSPGKCNLTHFLTSGVPDRLGAQMSDYATLLIHSQRLAIMPFFPKRQKQMLSAIFRLGHYIHTTKYSTYDMFLTETFLYRHGKSWKSNASH